MQLVIRELVPDEIIPKTSFTVEIKTMMGDDDGYDSLTVGPFRSGRDEDNLKHLLSVLKRMEEAYPNGRFSGDNYYHVLGFYQWFSGTRKPTMDRIPKEALKWSADEHNEAFRMADGFQTYWPDDPLVDGDSQSLESYEVFYYDTEGRKHCVDVVE